MQGSRTDWMAQGKFGIMVHWLSARTPQQYKHKIKGHDDAVNRFDIGIFQEGITGPATIKQLATLAKRLG